MTHYYLFMAKYLLGVPAQVLVSVLNQSGWQYVVAMILICPESFCTN